MNRRFALPVLVALVGAIVGSAWLARRSEQRILVYLVRHAEKAAAPKGDPSLTANGRTRAIALASVFDSAGVDAIYTSDLSRTIETAAPLANRLGIEPSLVGIRDNGSEQFVADVVSRLRARHWGHVVVVVSHSNTMPMIADALGAVLPTIDEATGYDHLFLLDVPREGPAKVTRSRYGPPPPTIRAGL